MILGALISFGLTSAAVWINPLSMSPAETLRDATPRVALIEVEGPFSGGQLSCGLSKAELELTLASGESRTVRVPFTVNAGEHESTPDSVDWSSGSARFVEWETSTRANDWSALPAGLRRRPIPVPPGTRVQPTVAGWVIFAAGLVLVGLFQRRAKVAAALGCTTAVALLSLPVTESVGSDGAIVVEGDAASGKWVRVEVHSQMAPVNLDRLLRLAVLPEGAELNWSSRSLPSGALLWQATAVGGSEPRIIKCERFYPPAHESEPAGQVSAANHPGLPLTATWVRPSSGGPLVSHGPWEPGMPLSGSEGSDSGPPSWLVAGLPQGVGVLLGQYRDEQAHEIWVRLIGFSED